MLDNQCKKLHEEVKRYTRELTLLKETNFKFRNIIKEKNLQIETAQIVKTYSNDSKGI